MGFAALVNTTLFNTILVPTKFGNSGSDIPQRALGKQMQAVNNFLSKNADDKYALDCQYTVKAIVDSQEITITNAASISGLRMLRNVEKKGYYDHTALLPGNVSYDAINISYTYSKEPTFVNWLKAGVESGDSYSIDLLLEFGVGDNKMVLMLEDACLFSWGLNGELNSSADTGTVLKENLNFSYSGLKIDVQTPKQQ